VALEQWREAGVDAEGGARANAAEEFALAPAGAQGTFKTGPEAAAVSGAEELPNLGNG
jgi:hypothetical protein